MLRARAIILNEHVAAQGITAKKPLQYRNLLQALEATSKTVLLHTFWNLINKLDVHEQAQECG